MNEKEHAQYSKELKEYSKKIIKSKKNAKALLVKAGIIDQNNELTDQYQPITPHDKPTVMR